MKAGQGLIRKCLWRPQFFYLLITPALYTVAKVLMPGIPKSMTIQLSEAVKAARKAQEETLGGSSSSSSSSSSAGKDVVSPLYSMKSDNQAKGTASEKEEGVDEGIELPQNKNHSAESPSIHISSDEGANGGIDRNYT